MIATEIRSLAGECTVRAFDSVARCLPPWLYAGPDNGTNSADATPNVRPSPVRTPVDRTIEHALMRYPDLLRRLAD